MGKVKRNFGLDIYRVICITLIVMGHMQSESFISKIRFSENKIDYLFQTFFGNAERLSINGFVMISAWFLYGKKFSARRILKCWLMVFFINVVVTIIACTYGIMPITSIYAIQAFLPILGRPQWYMCEYLLLLITSPMIDKMIQGIPKCQHRVLIVVGFALIVLFDSTMIFSANFTVPLFSEYIWFVYLYLLICYIKIYSESRLNLIKKKTWIFISAISYMLIVVLNIASELTENSLVISTANQYTAHYETILCFLYSLGLFMLLKNISHRDNQIISTIAKYTGYIYIVHSVPVLWRNEAFNIWENIFHVDYWYSKGMLIPSMIIITVVILAFGTVIGIIVDNYLIPVVCQLKVSKWIINKIDGFYSK